MTVPTTTALDAETPHPGGEGAPALAPTPPASPASPSALARIGSSFAMFRNRKSLTGLVILGFFVVLAVFGDLIAPYGPLDKDYSALKQPPSWQHLLGTSHLGEDIFSQIVYGTRGVLVCLLYTSPSPRD